MAYLDNNGVLYFWQKIKTYVANAISGKVDAETGKGLSTNDYTTEEKTKLSNIAAGAQVNVLEGIQKNGNTVTITNKIANISVPTKTSDLTNDSNFITLADVPDGAVASTTTPKMDGTANAGSETAFARGDHVHPSDSTKVDKVSGKGLSTNDYTTAEKNKLVGIESGAEENVIETISVNGSEQTVTDKTVDITVPTKVSDLTNDSGFLTSYTETDPTVPAWAKAANKPTYTATEVGALPDTTVIPSASTTAPKMDGNATVGSETAFARGDHVHPSDNTKVDKVSGKGLSTNDYTTAEKNKLSGIEAGAQVNVVTDVSESTDGDLNYVVIEKGEDSFTVLDYNSFVAMALITSDTLDNKVNKVEGKGLSTNDYTDDEKNKLAAFGAASTYALKTDITNMYKYKGSVAAVANLPSSGNTTGDVYNVEASGMNYAWNGSEWDALGEIFTITAITNSEIDTICT